jgi:hypothetical protein
VIARPLPQIEEFIGPRPGTRAGRTAARVRRSRTRRERYRGIRRILGTVGTLTICVVVYLALAANVMRLNYALGKEVQARARLADETTRLDDQIARLESRERLARVAAALGMHEPRSFAAVTLPVERPPVQPHGLAFLNWPR